MNDKFISPIEFDTLEQFLSNIKYNDGDMAIIDNLQTFPFIDAVKMGIHAALLCERGQIELDINGQSAIVCEDEILYCPVSGIIGRIIVSDDFECKILCMTDKILNDFIHNGARIVHKAVYIERINIIPLDQSSKERFLGYYNLARRGMVETGNPFHKEMIHSLVQSFLFFLCGYLQKFLSTVEPIHANYGEKLFQRFLGLLAQEELKRHKVDYYADKLCVTPKYLSIICNRMSGKPASDWIRDYTLDEIRHYLRNTDKPIKEISSLLGFPSVHSFGKYVRHNMGVSPKEYRERITSRH